VRRFSFVQIDAFTQTPLTGNACAVVFDTQSLTSHEMLAIAKEFNLSETAFVYPCEDGQADFEARYFTPEIEIPMAGHPTLATAFALLTSGRLPSRQGPTLLRLRLQVGVIQVILEGEKPAETEIHMFQQKPIFGRVYQPEEVMPVFGLCGQDLMPGATPQTVSTGTPQLMVPVKDLGTLRRAKLNSDRYQALRAEGDFFSPHLFCLEGATLQGSTFARHFGVPPDTFEDPFTGSATGGMAAYLWHYGFLKTPNFVAEQGHDLGRPGQAKVRVVGERDAIETVVVGGYAVKVMQGELHIPE